MIKKNILKGDTKQTKALSRNEFIPMLFRLKSVERKLTRISSSLSVSNRYTRLRVFFSLQRQCNLIPDGLYQQLLLLLCV